VLTEALPAAIGAEQGISFLAGGLHRGSPVMGGGH